MLLLWNCIAGLHPHCEGLRTARLIIIAEGFYKKHYVTRWGSGCESTFQETNVTQVYG